MRWSLGDLPNLSRTRGAVVEHARILSGDRPPDRPRDNRYNPAPRATLCASALRLDDIADILRFSYSPLPLFDQPSCGAGAGQSESSPLLPIPTWVAQMPPLAAERRHGR